MGNKHQKIISLLNILREAKSHTISKTWEMWISILREKYEETQALEKLLVS